MSQSSQSQETAQADSNAAGPESKSESESNPESDSTTNEDHSVGYEQQMVFGEDGDIEPEDDSVGTSLEAFGAEVDHSEEPKRVAKPSATRFGVDDRAQVPKQQNSEESDQRSLFANVENDQQTLGGENAANRCLFGSQNGSSDDPDEEESS